MHLNYCLSSRAVGFIVEVGAKRSVAEGETETPKAKRDIKTVIRRVFGGLGRSPQGLGVCGHLGYSRFNFFIKLFIYRLNSITVFTS